MKEFPLPAPPFAMVEPTAFDLKPDSTYYLHAENIQNFILPQKGIYWIRRKSDDNGGFTILRFAENFPKVTSPENMIPPLRYLSSKQEYREITEGNNKRAGMENFWIECAGSQDRARELIKIYYNRVKDSNTYFTSYLEGWKTDRGLIYTIFGPPNIVYRNSSSEQWIYGAENNMMSLSLTFLKMENPFTENDFNLSRNGTYKNTWYQAVDSWRQGRVWLDN
jgi:GWxTD domain-containing protein